MKCCWNKALLFFPYSRRDVELEQNVQDSRWQLGDTAEKAARPAGQSKPHVSSSLDTAKKEQNCSWDCAFVSHPRARDIPSRKELGFLLPASQNTHPCSLLPLFLLAIFIRYAFSNSLLIKQANTKNKQTKEGRKLFLPDLGSCSQRKPMHSGVLPHNPGAS